MHDVTETECHKFKNQKKIIKEKCRNYNQHMRTREQVQETRGRKQMNQQRQREQHTLQYKLNQRGGEVQVGRHCEQSCANEADVRQVCVWGGGDQADAQRNTGNTGVQSDNKTQEDMTTK